MDYDLAPSGSAHLPYGDESSGSSGDGGSSSSDSHPSPADSSYGPHDWGVDFAALGVAAAGPAFHHHHQAAAVLSHHSAAAAAAVKFAPRPHSHQLGQQPQHDALGTASNDFWSAPVAQAPFAGAASSTSSADSPAANPESNGTRDYFAHARQGHERVGMDFDDMVHEDVCGPSTLTSPTETVPTPLSTHVFSQAAPAAAVHAFHPLTAASMSANAASLSNPIDLFAVNAGIAPSLTSAQTPSPLHSPATEYPMPALVSATSTAPATRSSSVGRSRASIGGGGGGPGGEAETSMRDLSLSRRSDAWSSSGGGAPVAPHAPPASSSTSTSAHAAKAALHHAVGPSVNLVARDAVQAAHLIPAHSSPPAESVTNAELVVLGVPTLGAKSRVETQIKISLALVRPRHGGGAGGGGARVSDDMVMVDGGLDARAADDLERLGTWSHLRLPKNLALKSKPGKQLSAAALAKKAKPEPPAEQILSVDVAVVSATDPSQSIYICDNCQARELKRSLRKKDAKGKTYTAPAPVPDVDSPQRDEAEERKKVVVFNAQELVEFASGEIVLPTRVTCYCRHHKEKRGFRVTYTLRDHRGVVVATGSTPPIMITDDHKTNTAASKTASVASLAAAAHGVVAHDERSAAAAQAKRKTSKSAASTPAPARKERRDKAGSPASGTTTPSAHASGRPRRAATTRSRRGATDSDDESGEVGGAASEATKKVRPYDADQRPARAQGRKSAAASAQASRSPTFAMTPLRQASPVNFAPPHPSQSQASSRAPSTGMQTPQTMEGVSLPPLPHQVELALGLGGMEDSLMVDTPAQQQQQQQQQPSGLVSYLGDGARHSVSSDVDWRANLSTPPMSPGGSTGPSESYHSLFSGFPSPVGSSRELAPTPSAPGSAIPSFAIPATEPMPTSLTPSWTIPQQPEQLLPPSLPPRITHLIPGEGPVHGGIEVTVLGENFVQDLTCVFGDSAAVPTHYWSSSTLVAVLPPSANPGPVVVSIKGVPLTVEPGNGLQLFTYKDDSDRSLLELALQVVGLKMTGRLEDAAAVAMRIVGNSPSGAGAPGAGAGGMIGGGSTPGSQHSLGGGSATDTAALAATLNAAASSVYATPAASRATSRRSSFSSTASPRTSSAPVPPANAFSGEPRGFEGIVMKFLSLLDLDPSLLPGAAPSLPSSRPPISLANAQQHTLLHLATVLGFRRLVAFLVARGVTLDKEDRNGYTALHFAALYGRVNIARQLLDAGADVRARTRAGKTPLEVAQDRDDVDVEELLLARGAVSPAGALVATPTAATVLQLASPTRSFLRLSDAGDESEDAATEYASDWTVDADSDLSDSDIDDADDRDVWDDSEAQDADESALDETSPVRKPRVRSRQVSRNASSASLHHLVEAEHVEVVEHKRLPRFRRPSLPVPDAAVDAIPVGEPVAPQSRPPVTPLNHLASASSSWLSAKLKPTVQPGLDKLQPIAGSVTGAWEKAKANRFGVPTMHMPELTAFHAMPAALSRHMGSGPSTSKTKRRRAATVSESRSPAGDVEPDLGDEADESSTPFERLSLRDWRAAFQAPAWWTTKAPSSPPPQYSPRDELSAAASGASDDKPALDDDEASTSAIDTASSPRSGATTRLRMRRRTSAVSHVSDDTEVDAESDAGSTFGAVDSPLQVGIRSDAMLLAFWLPVLCVALYFAWTRWATQVQPVLDTFLDTVLPYTMRR
ncbi:uncharacterized protein RHOBADRAFT_55951 [Rhodotorula graminis WP1]|uniref:IPT/TIG domain-containing protein n=1 Tax=Rhodotorula graminis (strain WP1) TaxID=578459 RepID=A0A0N8PZJ4_RHOGW|nr:uncharacterized protein RHOBADRAFT_55951 [Rhodotorula graminis WP1]KPV72493.1 hypothetical protein RHOBADRAFT_55951 [Rhodotorula graminis WP1]